jgi:hypothetical protein
MDPFCKSYVENDLVSLHYVTFIEPLAIFPTEALSFDYKQFTNNSINKVIEAKRNDSSYYSKNIFSLSFCCTKNLMKFNSKTCHMKFSSSSYNYKVSAKRFVHNKVYHNKCILIILVLQMYIVKVT